MPGAGVEVGRPRPQVDDKTPVAQAGAVGGVEHGTTTRGEYDTGPLRQLIEDTRFSMTEPLLALQVKNGWYANARATFDLVVDINEFA